MNETVFQTPTGERIRSVIHPSGLAIYVYEKPQFTSCYAAFATKYGSVDTVFSLGGKAVEVPAGIAHFLEHKMFENEDCDAFERYAATGAAANAYTSFDRTCYLFSCAGDVRPSLRVLLDFVQKPYFTPQSVAKEQGIIGQEIKMCEDSPSRAVLFNMLQGLYHANPVRVDIAGTVDSIAQITDTLLYDCYHAFYNLHNMVLAVSGNTTLEQVLEVADELLIPAAPWQMIRPLSDEPAAAVRERVETTMPVAAPLFCLGYKKAVSTDYFPPDVAVAESRAAQMICGSASPLYARLLADGLINETFEPEFFGGRGFAMTMFSGETRDPDAVAAALRAEIDRVRQDGFDREAFEALKAAAYADTLRMLNSVEGCGELLVGTHICGQNPFDILEATASLTLEQVNAVVKNGFDPAASTLSIVRPK